MLLLQNNPHSCGNSKVASHWNIQYHTDYFPNSENI